MERDTSQDSSNLRRPHGNDLATNYRKHDVGQEWVIDVLEQEFGLHVEEWGIDMRHDDGPGLVFEHDAVDLKAYDENGDLVALVEVKTKGSAKWMGNFNKRHFHNYILLTQDFDVPVIMVMAHVDMNEAIIHDFFVAEMTKEACRDIPPFPDGNAGVTVRDTHMHDWDWFEQEVLDE